MRARIAMRGVGLAWIGRWIALTMLLALLGTVRLSKIRDALANAVRTSR